MKTIDERRGLPSASGAQRYSLCKGSFLAEQGLPDTRTEASERGDRIHAVLAGSAGMETLTLDEQEVARECLRQSDELIAGLGGDCVSYVEERLWRQSDWSGKADLIAVVPEAVALVVDYKTGWGDVDDSTTNMQLRALAVLVGLIYRVESVRVAILQPSVTRTPLVTEYSREDLVAAFEEINTLMQEVQQPGHPRTPHPDACKYCKANGTDRCPESKAGVVAIATRETSTIASPLALAEFLDACITAEKTIEKVREAAKAYLSTGLEIPGWTLSEGRETEKIVDAGKVFCNWIAMGGDAERFQKAVSVTKKALGEIAAKEWPQLPAKEVKSRVKELTAGATETKRSEPSLVRVA